MIILNLFSIFTAEENQEQKHATTRGVASSLARAHVIIVCSHAIFCLLLVLLKKKPLLIYLV